MASISSTMTMTAPMLDPGLSPALPPSARASGGQVEVLSLVLRLRPSPEVAALLRELSELIVASTPELSPGQAVPVEDELTEKLRTWGLKVLEECLNGTPDTKQIHEWLTELVLQILVDFNEDPLLYRDAYEIPCLIDGAHVFKATQLKTYLEAAISSPVYKDKSPFTMQPITIKSHDFAMGILKILHKLERQVFLPHPTLAKLTLAPAPLAPAASAIEEARLNGMRVATVHALAQSALRVKKMKRSQQLLEQILKISQERNALNAQMLKLEQERVRQADRAYHSAVENRFALMQDRHTQEITVLQKRIAELDDGLKKLQSELDSMRSAYTALSSQAASLQAQITHKTNQMSDLERRMHESEQASQSSGGGGGGGCVIM